MGARLLALLLVLSLASACSPDDFATLADTLADTTRVCSSDRAWIGGSPALTADAPEPWPGSSADALAADLESRGERAPGRYDDLGGRCLSPAGGYRR